MKPTRKIPKKRITGLWKPKRSVWFKKNDDSRLGMGFMGRQAHDEARMERGHHEDNRCSKCNKKLRYKDPTTSLCDTCLKGSFQGEDAQYRADMGMDDHMDFY